MQWEPDVRAVQAGVPGERAAGGVTWDFRVTGRPVPQGSMRERTVRPRKLGGRTRYVVHDRGPALTTWRQAIAAMARVDGVRLGPPTQAYAVFLSFYVVGPGPLTRGRDVDKLARAVLDALTGICWPDDGQVLRLSVSKTWATATQPAGVMVTIVRLDDPGGGRPE